MEPLSATKSAEILSTGIRAFASDTRSFPGTIQIRAQTILQDLRSVQPQVQTPASKLPEVQQLLWDGRMQKIVDKLNLLQCKDLDESSNTFLRGFECILGADYELIKQTSPEMITGAASVKAAFAILDNEKAHVSERALYIPQSTGAYTTNGSYFLYVKAPDNFGFSEIEKPSFVGKPSLQEAGSVGNPQGNTDVTRLGVDQGEGVIRERLIYKGQELLGVDCGVPPTCIIGLNSFQLGTRSHSEEIDQCLSRLQALDAQFSPNQFVRLMAKLGSREKIKAHFQEAIGSASQFFKDVAQAADILESNGDAATTAAVFKLLKTKGFQAESASQVKVELERRQIVKTLHKDIEALWEHYLRRPDPSDASNFLSLQRCIPSPTSISTLNADMREKLPVEEVHKFVIDVIFFNMDRHLGNALFSDGHVYLIDHGSCLPRPMPNGEALKQARFEFVNLPQCGMPLCEPFASLITNLNIEEYIANLRKDQRLHADRFGEKCHISEDCYNLIRLNIHLLKVGISLRKSFYEICLFQNVLNLDDKQHGGEIIEMYQKHFQAGSQADWKLIDKEIAVILSAPVSARIRNGERISTK